MADLGERPLSERINETVQAFGAGFTGTSLSAIQKAAREKQLIQKLKEGANNPRILEGAAAGELAISNPEAFKKLSSALGTRDETRQKAFYQDASKILKLMNAKQFQLIPDLLQSRIRELDAVGAESKDLTLGFAQSFQKAMESGDTEAMGELAGSLGEVVATGSQLFPELQLMPAARKVVKAADITEGGQIITQGPGGFQAEDVPGFVKPKAKLSSVQQKVEAEGIDPLSVAGQKRVRELNQGGRTDPSLSRTDNQVLEKASEQQLVSAGFANRVNDANVVLGELESTEGFDPASITAAVLSDVAVGNFVLSDEQQRYIQAKSDFITAVLRKESGAVISETEFIREDKKFFPKPGDKPGTIAQKAKSRLRAFENLNKQSKGVFDVQFGKKQGGTEITDAQIAELKTARPDLTEDQIRQALSAQ